MSIFFVGTIPSQLGQIATLSLLRVDVNLLHGTIPSSFGKLTNIVQFYASTNSLDGITNMYKLIWNYLLWLCHINIGTIPNELGSLSKIIKFAVFGNKLTGNIQ